MLSKYNKFLGVCLLMAFALTGVIMVSCDDDDDVVSGVVLDSYGPSPAERGAELKFIGKNLDQVNAIVFPGNVEQTTFVSKESNLLVVVVPEAAVSGALVLKTASGDVTPKTLLGIAEPITITSISPESVRPGEAVTIKGTYLNLVSGVSFEAGQTVDNADFESQSATEIVVVVPMSAQTGAVIVTDSLETEVQSEATLQVKLPTATSVAPNPVKAGQTLTITGTDLDLVTELEFGGLKRVSSDAFTTQTATSIVVDVPADVQAGEVQLLSASPIITNTGMLNLVTPAITGFSPTPVKLGSNLTITGTNLDLVSSVTFGGGANGTIESASPTSLVVIVPATATDATFSLNTHAGSSVVSSSSIEVLLPTITSFTPTTVNTADEPSITINGTDLDNVAAIGFSGGYKTDVAGSENSITVGVLPGSVTGKFKLYLTNGDSIESATALTIVPDVPNVTMLPEQAFIGSYMTIEGTNMDVPAEIIFPGNAKATSFAVKTATSIKVLVPMATTQGEGRIKFVTSKNEVLETEMVSFNFPGVEPIVDANLIINDFDEEGHDLNWDNWNGNAELLNSNPGLGISDNGNYLHCVSSAATGYWIWGCNHDQLPKKSVTTADHVLKIDIKITKALPADVNFRMSMGGNNIDLGNLGQTTPGGNWITVTFDLADFAGLPATIPTAGDWGFILAGGTPVDLTGLYMDNFRFQAK